MFIKCLLNANVNYVDRSDLIQQSQQSETDYYHNRNLLLTAAGTLKAVKFLFS